MYSEHHPQVTVLMPAYNAERYIRPAIASILNQTFRDFELLIIEDGSTDATEEIIGEFNDPRISVFKNEVNRGIVYSLNKGVALARGEYLARMDTDDLSEPNRLMLQYEYLANHPDIAICGSGMMLFNSKGSFGKVYYSLDSSALKAEMLFNSPFAHPSIMARREVLAANPYEPSALHAEDYDLWSRILLSHRGVNLPYFLLRYRISPNHITAVANRNADERKQVISRIQQENFAHLGYFPGEEVLDLHFQLSTTEGLKRINVKAIGIDVINRHIRQLLDHIGTTGYCHLRSFYEVAGKIYLKLLLYSGHRMGLKNLFSLLATRYVWAGIGMFIKLRAVYFFKGRSVN